MTNELDSFLAFQNYSHYDRDHISTKNNFLYDIEQHQDDEIQDFYFQDLYISRLYPNNQAPTINIFLICQPQFTPAIPQYPYYFYNPQSTLSIGQQYQQIQQPHFQSQYFLNIGQPISSSLISQSKSKIKTPKKHKKTTYDKKKHKSSKNTKENPKNKSKKDKKPQTFFKEIQFSDSLEGIFNYFQTHSKINDEVKLTFSSTYNGSINLLLNIKNEGNDFYLENKPNQWICFEFKKYKINLSSYSIRSSNDSVGNPHPKNWVIEGSQDNSTWKIIDEHQDDSALFKKNYVHTFHIKNNDQEFKYIRMRQTGLNWHGNNWLDISSIEFYGKLI